MGQGTSARFFSCAEKEAAKCEQQQQFSTAKNYRTAIRSFRRFTGSTALSLADITADRMASYVQWLRLQGVSLNTTVCYVKALRAYNRHLHRLQKMVRLDCNITSYVVRHTWASLAYDSNVELAVISSALGHTNPNTTRIYIRDIDNRRLAEANCKVLGRIL